MQLKLKVRLSQIYQVLNVVRLTTKQQVIVSIILQLREVIVKS